MKQINWKNAFLRVESLLHGSVSDGVYAEDRFLARLRQMHLSPQARRVIVMAMIFAAGTIVLHYESPKERDPSKQSFTRRESVSAATIPSFGFEYHTSPAEDLERIDLLHMSQAHSSIDAMMPEFTDIKIARLLAAKAGQGVRIRVLWPESAARVDETLGNPILKTLQSGHIAVHVLSDSKTFGIHGYVIDGSLVRLGSAAWVPSEEIYDRYDLVIVGGPAVGQFSGVFSENWGNSMDRQ